MTTGKRTVPLDMLSLEHGLKRIAIGTRGQEIALYAWKPEESGSDHEVRMSFAELYSLIEMLSKQPSEDAESLRLAAAAAGAKAGDELRPQRK